MWFLFCQVKTTVMFKPKYARFFKKQVRGKSHTCYLDQYPPQYKDKLQFLLD